MLGAKIWVCDSKGNWKLDTNYSSRFDDGQNTDEDLIPSKLSDGTYCIYSLDRPGVGQQECRDIVTEQQESPNSVPDISKFRFVANFEEYLEIDGKKSSKTFPWCVLLTAEIDLKRKIFTCDKDTKMNYIGEGQTSLDKPK